MSDYEERQHEIGTRDEQQEIASPHRDTVTAIEHGLWTALVDIVDDIAVAIVTGVGVALSLLALIIAASVGQTARPAQLIMLAGVPVVLGAMFALPLMFGPLRLERLARPKLVLNVAIALWCVANLVALTIGAALVSG